MLSALLLLPVAGAVAVALLPGRQTALIRGAAVAASAATLLYALILAARFDPAGGLQFFESYPWNPRLGTSFALGADGLSLSMVVLTALLSLIAVLASGSVRSKARPYFVLLLLLEAAVLGVFVARDWSLFYVFWELTLIPLFFLIDRMGGGNRHRAALNFVLYTMGGSVFMLVALLLLYDAVPGHSFGMAEMTEGARALPLNAQALVFAGLLIGFGVKMPIVPLHGWLPLAHVEAPSPVSILLSGVLLKMGAYGLLRAAETLPGMAYAASGWLAVLAFVNLVYGGVLAWQQRDVKAMVAYSSISHMGVVLLGIATLTGAGFNGAMMQMVAHGLAAGLLFLVVGLLVERSHGHDLGDFPVLAGRLPRFAFFTAFAFLAAIGLPGSAGFVAEIHALYGSTLRWGGWSILLLLAALVGAAYALRVVGRLCVGGAQSARSASTAAAIADMSLAETAAAALLAAAILALGLAPEPILALFAQKVADLSRLFAS